MKHRTTLALLIPLAAFMTNAEAKSLKGSKPNIILVMTDDQGMGELACLGNPVLKTPNLDRFYQQSTRFTDFHVSPTCAPTRAAIMSGRHEFKNGVTHTITERECMALNTTTFPQLLRKTGYETAVFGKWHLGDADAYQPYNRGFSEVLIHGCGGIGQTGQPGEGTSAGDFPANRENRYFDNVLMHNETVVQTKGFCTDVFFQSALSWIKKKHAEKTPYFAYIAVNAPHGPMIAPKKYTQRFLDQGWDEKKTAGRYGMIENIDDNFGVMMEKLTEWNALENTLVIFMTDNGQSHRSGIKKGEKVALYSGKFKSGKGSAYEGGTHVPAFWYWKGVLKEGVDIPVLTAHVDLYKTFCDLAGAPIPNDIQSIDGVTLLPLLENPKAAWPDRKLFVHRGRWSQGDAEKSQYAEAAVRSQRWRMVAPQKTAGTFELYDISQDPYEEKNVASQHPEVVKELTEAFDQWWEETVPLMVNESRKSDIVDAYTVRYEKQLKEKGIPDWAPAEF